MAQRLAGQKIFVSGGSRGLGAAIVQLCAKEGAQVVFSFRSQEKAAQKVLESLDGEGHKAVQLDIASEDSVKEAIQQALEALGGISGVVNNAGVTQDQLLLRMKPQQWASVLQTNLTGAYFVTQAFLKPMLRAKKGGSFVHISSVVGQLGQGGQTNYAAAKGGLEAFSRSLAREVANRQVRSNCVAPGFIETDMTKSLTTEQQQHILKEIPLQRTAHTDRDCPQRGFSLERGGELYHRPHPQCERRPFDVIMQLLIPPPPAPLPLGGENLWTALPFRGGGAKGASSYVIIN